MERRRLKGPTRREFEKRFPDDDACLEHLMRVRWGVSHHCVSCAREARYYRVKARRCYECEHCGYQVYPTAGTPFEKTRTSLKDWFFVMFLFCASRNGVAAKEVERQIGVTYKTAWRMCHQIRLYMGYVDGDDPVGGTGPDSKPVEIDKTFIGGHDRRGEDDKRVVIGMAERDGGEIITRVIPDRSAFFVTPTIKRHVKPDSRVTTDTARVFKGLAFKGFDHRTVNHSAGEWARNGDHTNTIEAFWKPWPREAGQSVG
jgi:transposase